MSSGTWRGLALANGENRRECLDVLRGVVENQLADLNPGVGEKWLDRTPITKVHGIMRPVRKTARTSESNIQRWSAV